MNCPNCGAFCADHQNFCIRCGVSLRLPQPVQKGTHRVPLLVMLILSVLGIAVFFLTPSNSCFELHTGTLLFYADRYDGSESIIVPNSIDGETVIEIGPGCFANCPWLTAVELPGTVQVIDAYAFQNCSALRGIRLPDALEAIGPAAFDGCESLEAVYISATVSLIAEDAFDNCPALSHIFYGGTYAQWLRLYGAYSDPAVCVYCIDGAYQWGFPLPVS